VLFRSGNFRRLDSPAITAGLLLFNNLEGD